MRAARPFLTTLLGRAAALLVGAAALLPAGADFHVLAAAHRAGHDVSAAHAEPARVAEACAHEPARHVESGGTAADTPRCLLCVRPSHAQPLPAVAQLVAHLPRRDAVVAEVAPRPRAPLAIALASRGPPRA